MAPLWYSARAAACGLAAVLLALPGETQVDAIALERTSCFGICPAY
jgi:hypothetical protein